MIALPPAPFSCSCYRPSTFAACLLLAAGQAFGAAAAHGREQATTPPAVPTAQPNDAPKPSVGKPVVDRKLDGVFDDWSVLDPVATRRDTVGDAVNGAADIVTLSLASDPLGFWIAIEFSQEVTLQGLDRPLTLYIDANGPKQGATSGYLPGADFAIIFSPTDAERGSSAGRSGGKARSQEYGEGVAVRALKPDGSFGDALTPAAIGLGMAPSHASRFFELRLDRTDERFADLAGSVKAMCLTPIASPPSSTTPAGEPAAVRVELSENVETVRSLLSPRRREPMPKAEAAAIDRAPGTALRVVSWNAELGALLKNPEPFGATLKAIRPDVILWQELGKEPNAESLASWMNEHVGGEGAPWAAVVSGGDLRTAVVARGPITVAPFLDGLKRTPGGNQDVRIAGAIVEQGGSKLLLASLHLKCCGRLNSKEDETRAAEVLAIHNAIEQALAKFRDAGSPLAGVVLGGDFNLVGSRAPVERIGTKLDLDGSDLDTVEAYQLDGLRNASWRSTGNDFLPGRLDWILTSGSTVTPLRSFVFSTEDLSEAAIATLALPPSALKEPSDHQPVVADLAVKPLPARSQP